MKKITNLNKKIVFYLLLISSVLLNKNAFSQVTICKIIYSYDNAGNRIRKVKECHFSDVNEERTGYGNSQINNQNFNQKQNVNENSRIEAKLFPNPTTGFMTLAVECENTTANMVFYLFDPLGKLLSTFNVSKGINSIDISTLLSGNYVATISIENENFDWQIIKQ